MSWISADNRGVVISVRVVPRASRNEVCGEVGGALKIRLRAPPVEGKANRMLIEFLGERIGIRRSRIALLAGEKGRGKRIRIESVTVETVSRALQTVSGQSSVVSHH